MNKVDEIIKRVQNLDDGLQEELLDILRTWQTGKKREYKRRKASADIDVVVGERVIQTTTRDLSASGAYIKAAGRFEPSKAVKIVFTVPGYEKPFKLNGMIVRVENDGLAIRFEDITPYFKQILDDVIWESQDSGNTDR